MRRLREVQNFIDGSSAERPGASTLWQVTKGGLDSLANDFVQIQNEFFQIFPAAIERWLDGQLPAELKDDPSATPNDDNLEAWDRKQATRNRQFAAISH